MLARTLALASVLVASAAVAACDTDPVHTQLVDALGPEAAGVPKGEYHRAGQPCVLCHGPDGPAKTQLSIAGTVFFGPSAAPSSPPPVGVDNVVVYLEDDAQSRFQTTTDCVGNFFVKPSDWTPQFPVLVTIAGCADGTPPPTTTPQSGKCDSGAQYLQASMVSHVGRDGSCAGCHQYVTQSTYYETPGLVHLSPTDGANVVQSQSCPYPPTPAVLPSYTPGGAM